MESVNSGKAAIEKMNAAVVADDSFHIALLNHQIPEMDGEQLAAAIKRESDLQET